jgi:hypothetical protein
MGMAGRPWLASAGTALALGGVAVVAVVGPVAASPAAESITTLEVAASVDGPAATLFPEGVRRLWVTFAYTGMAGSEVEITLNTDQGLVVFTQAAALRGEGTETWVVDGDAAARRVSGVLVAAAAAAHTNARLAAERQTGVNEYLAVVSYSVGQMSAAARLLDRIALSAAPAAALAEVAVATSSLEAIVVAANAIPPGETEARRLMAGRMLAPAAAAVTAAGDLEPLVAAESGLALPPTRRGAGENASHTVLARIDGRPARAVSIWIYDHRVFLPIVLERGLVAAPRP